MKESFHKYVVVILRGWKDISKIDYTKICFTLPTISLFPTFSLPDVLCDRLHLEVRDLIWDDDVALSLSECLLAEVFRRFPQPYGKLFGDVLVIECTPGKFPNTAE